MNSLYNLAYSINPVTNETILLTHYDHRDITKKLDSRGYRSNSMRNKPCHCGSGKKFKKCCWYLHRRKKGIPYKLVWA